MSIKTKSFLRSVATTIVAGAFALAATGAANAALLVNGSVGGAPTGVILDNLDWLALGNAGGISPQSGVTVSFDGGAKTVVGSATNQYAAPFLSGSNGNGFGNPIGSPQPDGVDATPYITSGSTGAVAGSFAQVLLPGNAEGGYLYFGLLWGSVDAYNTLSFYNDDVLVGTVTGADVVAAPNGNQGVNGTLYVNITSSERFNRVVATASQFAFEFDNIAFNARVPVPGPATLGLLGLGLVGLGFARRRRTA